MYAVRRRTGYIKRKSPARQWNAKPLEEFLLNPELAEAERYRSYRLQAAPTFLFQSSDQSRYAAIFSRWDVPNESPLRYSKQLREGIYRYFERLEASNGFPPDWHANPFTGQRAPENQHWSQIGDFAYGDIKVIWELSRFSFVYSLVRAYWRTGNELYPQMFWQLLEDWRSCNTPQLGVNWKCGQEKSFRVMAWLFGLHGFLQSPATTAQRIVMLAQMIAISGETIEANLDYALSQRNNHGISEAVGLCTIGLLFPGLERSSHWLNLGREALERQADELVYDDGSFSQHSVNYQRVMLHDYIWILRLGELNRKPFSASVIDRVAKAADFLYQLQDVSTGRLPNYGQNDGALVLPLSNCDFRDYRPLLQTAYYLCHRMRLYGEGPWDEDLLWMFGKEALNAPLAHVEKIDLNAPIGGYYTLRSREGFAFVRCSSYRHRPGQADMLHTDIWWRGQNIACDAGTYSYNAPSPWNNPLAHTTYHNTVTVDGLDQMDRVGKFLWLPWLKSKVHLHSRADEDLSLWEGEHDGYRRLKIPVSHRRAIVHIEEDNWLILDALNSTGSHNYRLHWLLQDAPYEWREDERFLLLDTPSGAFSIRVGASTEGECSLVRGDPSSPRGWRSPYYYYREPALSLDLTVRSTICCFWTFLTPTESSLFAKQHKKIAEMVNHFSLGPSQLNVIDMSLFNASRG